MNNELGIYIHIPFCISKCFYCNFCSYERKDTYINNYIDSVILEIISNSEILSERKISTIYIGGGTPSYIDSKYIKKIFEVLSMFFKEIPEEITIECNPNSLTDDKIKDYISCNINRFSIGVQTTKNDILKMIGRPHTYEDVLKALDILKENKVNNISLDLIYPLPTLNVPKFEESLNKIIYLTKKYDIKHISIYNLELHDNSKLKFLIDEEYLSLCSEDEEYEMKECIEKMLSKNDFKKYEISNFAKEGFESKHNLQYWNQKEYIGFGLGASSFINGKRYSNTTDIDDYIDYFLNKNYSLNINIAEEEMDKLNLMKEYVILRLRLKAGVNLNEFKNKFKVELKDIFGKEIDKLTKINLVCIDDTNFKLTKRGEELANIVWQEFI